MPCTVVSDSGELSANLQQDLSTCIHYWGLDQELCAARCKKKLAFDAWETPLGGRRDNMSHDEQVGRMTTRDHHCRNRLACHNHLLVIRSWLNPSSYKRPQPKIRAVELEVATMAVLDIILMLFPMFDLADLVSLAAMSRNVMNILLHCVRGTAGTTPYHSSPPV